MRNPYVVDRPLTDQDLFFGRDLSFGGLRDHLNGGQKLVLLCGQPRIGKTSFLNQLSVRFGSRYRVCLLEWDALPDHGAGPLWRMVLGVARAMAQEEPGREILEADAVSRVSDYLESLLSTVEAARHLVCFDGVPGTDVASRGEWDQAVSSMLSALDRTDNLAILLSIEGHPEEIGGVSSLGELPRMSLGPLREDEAEDLLTMPVRGTLAFDYEAIRQVHRLSGGEPFLLQLFGKILFERRAAAGWVGLPEVNHAIDQIAASGASQFERNWEACSPAGQLVLCAFAEMTGHHGVGSGKDVGLCLARLRVHMPAQDVEDALLELVGRGMLDRLGSATYRFRNGIFRHWLKQKISAIDIVRRAQGYRRFRPRPISLLRGKRVDWVGLFLWLVSGLLALLIAFVWRSRETNTFWSVVPTPSPSGLAASPPTPTFALPTPEKGVAPGRIVYVSKDSPDDPWQIYAMRSDGSDPVRLTRNQSNDTSPVWAPDGRHVAFVSDRDGNREVYVMNADGNEQLNLTAHPAEDWTPSWSPDGQRLAFASFRDGNWEICVMDGDGSNQQRLTQADGADYGPSWSPDGEQIAFVSNRDGNLEIYVMDADGSNQTRLTDHDATDHSPTWSPDGTQLLWESYREDNMEIYAANVDGSGLCNLSKDAYADDHGPTWSPWGRRIAFFSNRDRGWDIYTLDLETGERVNLTMSPSLEQGPHWGR